MPRVRVLYVTGWTRSGTTLLGNVLNELPGVVHAGELHYLWRNGVLGQGTNSTCGCGSPLTRCGLWSPLLACAVASAAGARRQVELQQRLLRTRHTLARLAEARGVRRAAGVDEAVNRSVACYAALAGNGGERLVVDGSKYPAEAAALLATDDVDLRVLHMVRDPRAVAQSYAGAKAYIDPMRPATSSAFWTAFNLASEAVGAAAGPRYLRVRHEDLCARPAGVLTEVLRFAGLDDQPPVEGTNEVLLGENHTVTGNPDRLRRGMTSIRPDERWRQELSRRDRWAATLTALPLLARYGYAAAPAGAPIGREARTWISA